VVPFLQQACCWKESELRLARLIDQAFRLLIFFRFFSFIAPCYAEDVSVPSPSCVDVESFEYVYYTKRWNA